MLRFNFIIFIMYCILASSVLHSQNLCLFDELHQELLKESLGYRQSVEQLNQSILLKHDQLGMATLANPKVYTLPVVVHLIFPTGTPIGSLSNLTDQEVERGLSLLNQAFSNSGPFLSPEGVDVGIQFCLAKRDPQGKPTLGITRNESVLVNEMTCAPGTNSASDANLKQLVNWDCKKYINIWLVTDLYNGAFGCGLAGYAYFPGAPCTVDGIVQEARYWTSVGGTRITAHEMGHYFALHHTFNGGCINSDCTRDGDLVCDTPPDNSASFAACNTNSCNSEIPDREDDNTNYMDYSSCNTPHFTSGQAARMISALELSRSGLIQSEGCLIVGEYDIKISKVNIDGNLCSDSLCLEVIYTNIGIKEIDQINFEIKLDNNLPVTEIWLGSLLPGESDTINLPCMYVIYGPHQLEVNLSLHSSKTDNYPDNNQKKILFQSYDSPELVLDTIFPSRCKSDGIANLKVNKGSRPFQFQLSNRSFSQSDPVFQLLTPGNYVLSVTDVNGCKDTIQFFIPDSCKSTPNKKFILNNNAQSTGGDCYRLTEALTVQSGSMWYEDKVNFNKSFDVYFNFNLGCLDGNGADGIAFVLQPISTSIGILGGGIGYQGIRPSLAVEFDTYQNQEYADPNYDHIAIMRNGNILHNNADNLAGPVGVFPLRLNAEDCNWHRGLIRWIASTKTIEVYVDCFLRLSLTHDLVKDIFSNDPNVYFGFTSATGGAVNVHQVCLNYITGIHEIKDQIICKGESVQISAASVFRRYNWTPTQFISNPLIHNPVFNPDTTTTYFLRMEDDCGIVYRDTVRIEVKEIDLKVKAYLKDSCAPLNEVYIEVINAADFPNGEYSIDGIQFSKDTIFRIGDQDQVTVYMKLGNCISPRLITLIDQRKPLKDSVIFTQSLTCKDSGIIILTGLDGEEPYEYSIDGIQWQSQGEFNHLTSGLYKLHVRDNKNCSVERSIEIYDFRNKLQVQIDSSKTMKSCCDTTSYIYASATGSVPYYYYSLDGSPWKIEGKFESILPGTHILIARDEFGCISDSLSFNIYDLRRTDSIVQHIEICPRDSFNFNGHTYFQTGTYYDQFFNVECCDSTVITKLKLIPENVFNQNISICSGQEYQIGNNVYNKTGIYSDTLVSHQSCDSIVFTMLQVLNPVETRQSIHLCEGEYIEVGNSKYEEGGSYLDSLKTSYQCDSLVFTNITINPVHKIDQKFILCKDDQIRIGNKIYNTPGIYIDSLKNEYFCDSILTSQLIKDTVYFDIEFTPPLCYGIHDGRIEINNTKGIAPFEVRWGQDGAWTKQLLFQDLEPGDYFLSVRDSLGCFEEQWINLPVPFEISIDVAQRLEVLIGNQVILQPNINFSPSFILWEPSTGLSCTHCLNPIVNIQEDGEYTLILRDKNGCEIKAKVFIKVLIEGDIYVPNIFSPNGDQINDWFYVFGNAAFDEVEEMRIYSRWGELIFENRKFKINEQGSGWNGTIENNEICLPGVYVYYIKAQRKDGNWIELNGDVNLVR